MDWQPSTYIPLVLLIFAVFSASVSWWLAVGEEEERRAMPVDSGRGDARVLTELTNKLSTLQAEVRALRSSEVDMRSAVQHPNAMSNRAGPAPFTQQTGHTTQSPTRTDPTRPGGGSSALTGLPQTQHAFGYPGESSAYGSSGAEGGYGGSENPAYQPARLMYQLDPAKLLPEQWSEAYRAAPHDMVQRYLDNSQTQWSEIVQLGNLNIWALRAGSGQWQLMHKLGVMLDKNFGGDFFQVGGSGSYVAVVNRPATVVASASPADFRSFRRDALDDWKQRGAVAQGNLTCSDNPEAR